MSIFWPKAIPQYGLEHSNFEVKLTAFQKEYSNYYLIGNYTDGVSIGDCVKKAKKLTEQLIKDQG